MKAFELAVARDAAHAVALLAEHGPSVKVLAGGTDLLVDFKSASDVPRVVVDISRAADLKGIAVTDRGLRIGALLAFVFMVVIIGGLGSIKGTLVSAFIVGKVVSIGSLIYAPLAQMAPFAIMLLILLIKPTGLYGSALLKK